MRVRVPTILVTGPVGVGKTTLIDEMSGLLRAADIPHASVDFDQLTASYPRSPDDDMWGTTLGLANLAAMWRNYSALGADRLLIARVIEDRKELEGYRGAVPGAEIVVVRLRASPSTLQQRVRQRGEGRGMQWHLDRAVELAPLMDEQRVEDVVVETEGRQPGELAREVLQRVGWLPPGHGDAAGRPDGPGGPGGPGGP
jgi:energy-coupling factor transporter ATP-binding protein EcfA2